LVGSGSGGVDRVGGGASSGAGVAGSVGAVAGMSGSASGVESYRSVGRAGLGSSGMATMGSDYHSAGYASSKDRDYCALIWDVEASSKGVKQSKFLYNTLVYETTILESSVTVQLISSTLFFLPAPVVRLAHNSGVASLAWMSNGDLLAVGCMQRSIQIYDLRIQGTSAPPISTNAHDNAVHGIKVDHHSEGSFMFATFSKGLAEPVKLWDMRRMDSCVSEIKLNPTKSSRTSAQTSNLVSVSDIEWDTSSSGILSVVCNDIIRYYDTRINPSRPTLSRMTHSHATIQSVAFLPRPAECQRMIAIDVDGYVRDLPLHQVAPLEISNRDGRVSCSTEGTVWAGSATEGECLKETF
jgi:WD40 repeat protein